MYKTILAIARNDADRPRDHRPHQVAGPDDGSRVVLLHVATGVPAQIHGSDAAGKEIEDDQAYLAKIQLEFRDAGIETDAELSFGDPVTEIVKWVHEKGCDLVAMSTHGHKFVADLLLRDGDGELRAAPR